MGDLAEAALWPPVLKLICGTIRESNRKDAMTFIQAQATGRNFPERQRGRPLEQTEAFLKALRAALGSSQPAARRSSP